MTCALTEGNHWHDAVTNAKKDHGHQSVDTKTQAKRCQCERTKVCQDVVVNDHDQADDQIHNHRRKPCLVNGAANGQAGYQVTSVEMISGSAELEEIEGHRSRYHLRNDRCQGSTSNTKFREKPPPENQKRFQDHQNERKGQDDIHG